METAQSGPADAGQASAIDRAIDAVGGLTAMAAACEVSPAAVSKWRQKVPAERVVQIEAATAGAVRREELRPDLYRAVEAGA